MLSLANKSLLFLKYGAIKTEVRESQHAPALKKPAGNTEISTKTFDLPSPEKCLSKIQGFASLLSF